MPKPTSIRELNFNEACEFLALSPNEVTTLREIGIVVCVRQKGRLFYPEDLLSITQRLLQVAKDQGWDLKTLTWYADLLFFHAIERELLLPIDIPENIDRLASSWLETPNLERILRNFEQTLNGSDDAFNNLVRSVVVIGENWLWQSPESLEQSSLYPLIICLEHQGVEIVGKEESVARDATTTFMALVLTFTLIAPPISAELSQLIEAFQSRFKNNDALPNAVTPSDKVFIEREGMIAIDSFYASKRPEIHSLPDEVEWEKYDDRIVAERRTISLVMPVPDEDPDRPGQQNDVIDNILDLIRPFLGPTGARVVQLLYEIANDPPNWRTPVITVDTNTILDRLGFTRDANGYHRSKNRAALRDILNFAHRLEVVGEYPDLENGRRVTRAVQQPVISLLGATFDAEERVGITTSELFRKGLPSTMKIRLNFYEGIRRLDGKLGTKYVLMPRLAEPSALQKANYAATHEALKAYFLLQYRQLHMKTRTLRITRQATLESANIRNKNPRQATATLRKALNRLLDEGFLEGYSSDIPSDDHQSFEIVLSNAAMVNREDE